MSDFPGFGGFSSAVISTQDRRLAHWPVGIPSAATWPAANRAYYHPVLVPEPTIVTKIATRIGGATSGNLDLGIYDEQGVRLVSTGSTAMGAINTIQTIDVTDTLLTPGVYYLAMAVDNTTASFSNLASGGISAAALSMMGIRQEASAFPLPATATFASITSTSVYSVAITCTTRIPVL